MIKFVNVLNFSILVHKIIENIENLPPQLPAKGQLTVQKSKTMHLIKRKSKEKLLSDNFGLI